MSARYCLSLVALVACQGQVIDNSDATTKADSTTVSPDSIATGIDAVDGAIDAPIAPPDVQVAQSTATRITSPTVSSTDQSALESANEAFAFDIYGQMKAVAGNLFFSPLSLDEALTMLYAGAATQTKTEMATALQVSTFSSDANLFAAWDALDLKLNTLKNAYGDSGATGANGNPFALDIVNGLFIQQNYAIEAPFLTTLASDFGAVADLLDFEGNPVAAENVINQWGDYNTQGAIPNVLPPGAIDNTVRLVLANAVYLSAGWQLPFDASATNSQSFTRLDSSTVQVSMMHQTSYFYYVGTSDYQAIEIPYSVGGLSMMIIMPTAGTFSTFETAFTPAQFDAIRAGFLPTYVQLAMPKMALDTGSMNLVPTLQALGMVTAFTTSADFSGITPSDQIAVSGVNQEATLAVAESGTVAAAITTVTVTEWTTTQTTPTQQPVVMTIDHPFFVFVYDSSSQSILFQGRIVDPTSAQ